MKFVGRVPELKLMEEHYRSGRSVLLPIYGRRRVGKSRLIDEFIKGKPCIYFLGKRATAELQLQEFCETAQRLLQNEGLAHTRFQTWEAALQTVTRLWKQEQKLVIVMDELQWTAEESPELPSVLQGLWDREWKQNSKLMIILCGSHQGFMERDILGQKSPLFGRRSDQIRLGPLSFPEASQMLRQYSDADRAGIYFLVGGIPAYLERFPAGKSLRRAIVEEFCSEMKFFALEPQFLLREELREPSRYFTILARMANHRIRQKELAGLCQLDPGVLAGYLETMGNLGYIGKVYPVSPGKVNPRQVQYEITDPMLRFWFRFIFPNMQLCRPGQEQTVFDQCIAPQLESYFGSCFEKLCQESMIGNYRRNQILWEHVGQYWNSDIQIDVVGLRRDNWIDFGECKWGECGAIANEGRILMDKCSRYPSPAHFSHGFHLFLKDKGKGSPNDLENLQVHRLADLFH